MKLSIIKLLFLALISLNISSIYAQNDEIDEDEASRINDDDDEVETQENEEESAFNRLNVFRIRSETELNYLTELLDFAILQFYYVPHSTNSKIVAEELIKVNKRIDNLAIIAAINCEDFQPANFKHCKTTDYKKDSFPKLRLFVPPEKRFDYETRTLKKHLDMPYTEKDMKEITIFNFISQNIPNKSQQLNSFNLTPFLNSDAMNKVILFTDKQYPGLLFRGLTNNYYDRLLFGTVHKSEKEIVDRFGITSFPSLMIYKTTDRNMLMNEPEILHYTLNPNNIEKIMEFFNPHTLLEKRYITSKRGIPDESGEDLARNMEFMEIDKTNYQRFFERYAHKKIMVLFHTKNKLKISVKKYLMESHDYFLNVFINCKGERDFCKDTFGVEKFPSLRLYEENSFNSSIQEEEARFGNYTSFNPSTNVTFLEDFNKYTSTRGIITNSTEFNFRFNLGFSKDKRKFSVISFQNAEEQRVSSNIVKLLLLCFIYS